MGMLEGMEALSIKGQTEILITSLVDQVKASPCQQGDDSNCSETMGSQIQLPEDILHQIHALMPLQDAAQAACVSSAFLRSWKSYPNIILSIESLGIKKELAEKDEIKRDFISRVEHIMRNHSGKGVKKFMLNTYPCSNLDHSYVDRWLQIAATPSIQEFELFMSTSEDIKYNFPRSFLSSEWGSSIQSFILINCSFHSAAQIGCMRSLKYLKLDSVNITGEELYGFLSIAGALQHLDISSCDEIICLKIPYMLRQLDTLVVYDCEMLEMIDSNAPKLSTFFYAGCQIHISLGDALHVRKVTLWRDSSPDGLYYAGNNIPFITPYLQTLVLTTSFEKVNTPALVGRFLHLKYLEIETGKKFSPDYDFCSIVSFLDASPALETFILRIGSPKIRSDSILDAADAESMHQRCVSGRVHDSLKKVMITGFCSAKSMIALTIHIIENTKSLECLTLDTTLGHNWRFVKIDFCLWMSKDGLVEAEKALVAIRRYVEGRVPPAVDLKVIEPCSKCIQ